MAKRRLNIFPKRCIFDAWQEYTLLLKRFICPHTKSNFAMLMWNVIFSTNETSTRELKGNKKKIKQIRKK